MQDMLTVAAWAHSVGISKQAGYSAVKRCGIPLVDGKVDALVAGTLYKRRTRERVNTARTASQAAESASAAPPAADHISYEEARRRREVADALTAELRHREVCGELVQAIDVRASLAKRVVTFREGLLQIPDRLSAQLSAETDQGAIRRLLDVEIRATLAHLVEAL